MGLDLYMITKKDFDKNEWNKLAYGRKTWAIAHFFADRSKMYDNDYAAFLVPESAWDDFYKSFKHLKLRLKIAVHMYHRAYNKRDKLCTEEGPNFIITDRTMEKIDKCDEALNFWYDVIEAILNRVLENRYYLGADWEGNAVLKWLAAYKKIKKLYRQGEEIVMVESY